MAEWTVWDGWTHHPPKNVGKRHFFNNDLLFFLIEKFFFVGGRLCHEVCGILVPRSGIELAPPALEAWSLNHWTTREVPVGKYFIS